MRAKSNAAMTHTVFLLYRVVSCFRIAPPSISSVILRERSESKDPDNIYILVAVESFLPMLFVRKPESAFLQEVFSGSFDLRSSRKLLSRGAQDDTE